MLILIRVMLAVYVVAINVYGFMLLRFQKNRSEENSETSVKDGKLFIAGLLGGAIGIYLAMFILSYRLQSMFLMIVMPLLIVLNAFFVILAVTSDFGVVVQGVSMILK